MTAHVSMGVGNVETQASAFCDAALEPLGYKYLRAAR
jgi:hypothetical protein